MHDNAPFRIRLRKPGIGRSQADEVGTTRPATSVPPS
jgi:hypothetical protein